MLKKFVYKMVLPKKTLKSGMYPIKFDWIHSSVRILILPDNLHLRGSHDMYDIISDSGKFIGFLTDPFNEYGGYITGVDEP